MTVVAALESGGSRGIVLMAGPAMAAVALTMILPDQLTSTGSAPSHAAVVLDTTLGVPPDARFKGAAVAAARVAAALLEDFAPEGSDACPDRITIGVAGNIDLTFLAHGRQYHATLSVDEDGQAVLAFVDRDRGTWQLLDVDPQSFEWQQKLTEFLDAPDAAFA